MQRSRRTAVYALVTGLLTAGTLTATISAASANVAGFCNGSGADATCTVTESITAPSSITVGVTATDNAEAAVTWSVSCTLNGTTAAESGGVTSETPAQDALTPLPATAGGTCAVTAKVVLASTDTTNTLSVALTYTTGASPTPSPSPTTTSTSPPVAYQPWHGYDGKCLDDTGNSSAIRTKVQIWTCGATDKAQYFQYSGGELQHNGLCVNDKGSGGNGSKVIMYTCNGSSNEIWSHLANGELKMKANGGKYCLDDPAYSTHNGTQLDVWTCKDSSNQRWYQP